MLMTLRDDRVVAQGLDDVAERPSGPSSLTSRLAYSGFVSR